MKQHTKILTVLASILFLTTLASAQFTGDPELQEYQSPTINVDQSSNTATATFYLENTGTSFAEDQTYVLEIQPIQQDTFSFLSTLGVSQAQTCDPDQPENVHKEIVFTAGEQKTISITTPINGEGTLEPGVYQMKALTVTGCATTNDNVQSVNPYGWGTEIGEEFIVEKDTDTGGGDDNTGISNPSDPSTSTVWVSYSNSDSCFQISESNAPASMETFENREACLEANNLPTLPVLPLAAGTSLVLVLAGLVYWRLQ